jgi:hypothetical protein
MTALRRKQYFIPAREPGESASRLMKEILLR